LPFSDLKFSRIAGVARVGAVRAALAPEHREEATQLAAQYFAEELLSSKLRAAIMRALEEDQEYLGRH